MAGTSIFSLGDGNPGMANVGHELGSKAGYACLAGDILKTVFAVTITHSLFPALGFAGIAWTGLGATLGHIFPFWHGFKGGKGVTTISTTVMLISPLWGCIAGIVGLVTIILAGYLSVGAVVAMGFYAAVMALTQRFEPALVCFIFTLLTLYCHGSKLRGIKDGTTRRASLSTKFWAKVRGNK